MDTDNFHAAGSDDIWYLAYGSNMSRAKFTGSRGITPKAAARVRIPGWVLALNIPGLPYSEPTFMSVVPREPLAIRQRARLVHVDLRDQGSRKNYLSGDKSPEVAIEQDPDVLGVAYLITKIQYIHVIASEGGGTAYNDIELQAIPVDGSDKAKTGEKISVRTLGSAMVREPWPKPSQRYMDIVTSGSIEAGMPAYYQKYLEDIQVYKKPKDIRRKTGTAIFLAMWGPVMLLLEKITKASIKNDGYAPLIVIWLVRGTMYLIWLIHDKIFVPIIGRGDGYEQEIKTTINEMDASGEKRALLQHKNDKVCTYV